MMKRNENKKQILLLWSFSLLAGSLCSALPTLADTKAHFEASEKQDRNVDRVAVQSQENAIKKLHGLLKKFKGTRQEPILLMRLAEGLQENAEILFRIAFAKNQDSHESPEFRRYQKTLESEIEILTRIIGSFSDLSNIDSAYSMRGKAREELKQKNLAKQDYLKLTQLYPESPHALNAFMALAEMSSDDNSHLESIGYLTAVVKQPESPYYPLALYKMAWSYFNLKDLANALSYIEKHIRYCQKLVSDPKGAKASDLAMRENSLMDAALFYYEGNESHPDQYPLDSTLSYFESLDPKESLGKMSVRMAKLLRSHRRDSELVKWKDQLIRKEQQRPETIEVVTLYLEHLYNQAKLDDLATSVQDIVLLHKKNEAAVKQTDSYQTARKFLIETADLLQNKLAKVPKQKMDKNDKTVATLMKTLSAVYHGFIQTVPEEDPRVVQARYNLAETLFNVGEFEEAAQNYRWILAHFDARSKFKEFDIQLKAISSRYESLRLAQLIPQDLKLETVDRQSPEDVLHRLKPLASEWITWIDALEKKAEGSQPSFENFQFEANRMIYSQGGVQWALNRLVDFATQKPHSKYAIPSLNLCLDTLVKNQNWAETYRISMRGAKIKWTDPQFQPKLLTLAADSKYKIAEALFADKKLDDCLGEAQDLIKQFKSSDRVSDAMYLVSQIHLLKADPEKAAEGFTQLASLYPKSRSAPGALLALAKILEQSYDLDRAVSYYSGYLSNPLPEDVQTRKQVLERIHFLNWVTQKEDQRCGESESKDCEKFRAFHLLTQQKSSALSGRSLASQDALNNANSGTPENRFLWSAVGLTYQKKIELHRRLVMIRNIAKGWGGLAPLEQISLASWLNSSMVQFFREVRAELRTAVPLSKISPKAIARRAEWIQEVEKAASVAVALPWNRVRSGVLLQLSLVYKDFTYSLLNLSYPKEMTEEEKKSAEQEVQTLVGPFQAKSKEIATRAFQIASNSSVEDDVMDELSKEFPDLQKKNLDELQKKIPSFQAYAKILPLDLSVLNLIDSSFQKIASTSSTDVISKLIKSWVESYSKKNWTKAAFLLSDSNVKNQIDGNLVKAMQSLMLIEMGAKAEGLAELQSLSEKLPADKQLELNRKIVRHYIKSASVENASRIFQEIEKLNGQAVSQAKERGSS